MPDKEEYLKAFKIHLDMTFNQYKLTNINIDHLTISKWNEYEYPTVLTFEWEGKGNPTKEDMHDLLNSVDTYIVPEKERIIRTSSGRPYLTRFQDIHHNNPKAEHTENYKTVVIYYHGHSKRVSESVASDI